ncbi:hybrid sensor histidine kinase/response regulator, partial [Ralstonia sp. 1138]|uniref:hybrid sensor histidine kinase/response regulator n=1 Tax=Ralstonia sp. 1138 TaxID=3156423 RepID=UPI003393BD12
MVWTYVLPQPYDNLLLRLSAALVCIPLIFQARWPKRLGSALLIYWHCCLVYVLPFVCTFLTIRNGFSTMWMMTEVMMIFILALCIDCPPLLMVCIGVGMVSSATVAVLTSPISIVLSATDLSNIALLPVVTLCSMAFSYAISKGRTSVERNRALKALAGSIAHEMRNPLSQLRHVLDGMEEALPVSSDGDRPLVLSQTNAASLYRHLAQGQLSIERGLRIITMTLDEVSAKPIRPDRLTYLGAADTTRKALDEYGFADENERRKVKLHVVEDFTFKVDETVYLFTLFNLIKNALCHMAARPGATLTLTVDRHTVVVRDTGPGISPDMLPYLFEPFRTVGNSAGTGLGLAYCQRAMYAFGGTISCRSEVGKFTEFTLLFPPVSQSELDSHYQAIWQQAMSAFVDKRILLVDDTQAERYLLRQKLNGLPVHFHHAESGLQALQMMRQHHYDLILMDLSMPVLDGYATTEKIRSGEVPGYESVPIVAYTNEPPHIAKLKVAKVGMAGFVSKMYSRWEMVQILQHALESSLLTGCETAMLAGKTVLLADDDLYGRAIVRTLLQKHRMQVVDVAHGRAVLDYLASGAPCDVCVLDINMPGMDGVEAARTIRAQSSMYQSVPIVALTGHTHEAILESARTAGVDDFLIKPVDSG